MTEKNSTIISNSILSLLDALQRHTLFLITSTFVVIISTYSEGRLKIGGIDIPNRFVFYVSVGLLFYSFWNLGRLSSKIKQLIMSLPSISEEDKCALFSHHWILSPFNKIGFNKLNFIDCVPVSLGFYLICASGKYIVMHFNTSSALYIWSQIFPDLCRNIIVWSACIVLVFLYVLFLKNLGDIIKKIYHSNRRYYIYTIGLALFMTIIEELIKQIAKA